MSNYRSVDYEKLAGVMKALANPRRLAIVVRLLAACGGEESCPDGEMTACVSALGEGLGIAPSTVSHHIKELRYAGLLEVERRGKRIHCRVKEEGLVDLLHLFEILGSVPGPRRTVSGR